MTVRRGDYGGGPPAVTADSLEMGAGEVTVLTISDVDPNVEVPQPGQAPRRVLVLRFAEITAEGNGQQPAFYANKTSIGRLIDGLGDDETKWIGRKVPLYATEQINPNTGEPSLSLWVVDPKSWDKHVKGFARAEKRAKRR